MACAKRKRILRIYIRALSSTHFGIIFILNVEQSVHILRLLLQNRGISYAITDRNFVVTLADGAPDCIDQSLALGRRIDVVLPELIGSEAELQAILDGELPRLQFPLINRSRGDRETPTFLDDLNAQLQFFPPAHDNGEVEISDGGDSYYLTITVLPHQRYGEITGLIVFVEDVTEEGLIQQRITQHRNELTLLRDQLARQNVRLQAANRELRQLDELKSRFVSVAAHELRTPLTAISGYTELLRDGSFGLLDERQRRPLTIIAQSTDRLLEIINNLLDVSRIETGRVQLNMRPTPLQQIIRRCLDEYHLVVEKRGQTLTVDLPSDAPLLLCDLARTVQVLGNLLGNASKYTPEGGSIHLSAGPAAQAGYFQIAVQDTGIGIPLAEQQRIFGTFYRASNADQTNAAGAGLGLHISRSLVELQGGEIHFESEPGQGSMFFFTLPLAE